jgi:tRNA pseudouridine55 synthase
VNAAGSISREPSRSAPPRPETSGLLVVDKPAGPTSHDVVERVRLRLGAPGAGHLGTLDPGATGLLLIAVGAATRCVPVWQRGAKTYEATIRLGLETHTQDLQGEVLARREAIPAEAVIRDATLAFIGDIEQVPPMVSAIKVRGKRLHQLARRGESVARPARRVRVEEWTWLEFAPPDARCRIRCSGGTYVRALAHDLGRALGCGAAVAALRRLASDPFDLSRAVTIDDLERLEPEAIWSRAGIPLREALAHLPAIALSEDEARRIGHGNPIAREGGALVAARSGGAEPTHAEVLLTDESGTPLALAERRISETDGGAWLHPRVVFPWAVREGNS